MDESNNDVELGDILNSSVEDQAKLVAQIYKESLRKDINDWMRQYTVPMLLIFGTLQWTGLADFSWWVLTSPIWVGLIVSNIIFYFLMQVVKAYGKNKFLSNRNSSS